MNGYLLVGLMGICLGWAGGWYATGRWQHRNPTRNEKLSRWVYRHLDEIIGATKHENQRRADLRFRCVEQRRWFWWLVYPRKLREWIADRFWPRAHLTPGGNPLPSDRRIRQYVWPSKDLRTWTIRYTPEAPANWPQFEEWLCRGRPNQGGGLAQALHLKWTPGLFEVERVWSEDLVRLTVTRPVPVPDELLASEELA